MPAAVSFKFGTQLFSEDVEFVSLENKPRVSPQVIPRRDGTRSEEAVMGPARVQMSLKMRGASQTALRTAFDTMKKNLFKQKGDLFVFDDRYFKDAQVDNFQTSWIVGSGMLALVVGITFHCDDPLQWSQALSTDSQTATSSPKTWSVDSDGDAPTRPLITIENNTGSTISDDILIENETLNKSLAFTGDLLNGETLTIDMEDRTLLNGVTSEISGLDGEFWWLLPGTNNLKYTGAVGGSGVDIDLSWQDRFYL